MADNKEKEKEKEITSAYLEELKTEINGIVDKKDEVSEEMAKVFAEFKGKDIPADKLESLEKMREEIKGYNDKYAEVNEQYQLMLPLTTIEERAEAEKTADVKGMTYDRTQLNELFTKAIDKFKGANILGGNKKSIGNMFYDIFKAHKIKSFGQISQNSGIKLKVYWDGAKPEENNKDIKDIKSLYSNNNVVFVNGDDEEIVGQLGYCGVMDDPYFCPFVIPADDFENCLTQATLTAPRLRYQRFDTIDANPASVPETIYGNYGRNATYEQDGTKPESTFSLQYADLAASKIAHYVVASDEVLEDCSSVVDMIDNFLVAYLLKEKRRQLVAGNPSLAPLDMRGLLYQPDVLSRIHRTDGEADDNIYDTLRRAMTDLYYQGTDTSNLCVIMNPRDLEIIDLQKDDNGRYLFNEETCMTRQLRCFNISTSVDMPEGKAAVGEMANNWMFYVRRPLEVKVGLTGFQFIENTQTFLAEMKGLAFLRCPQKVELISGITA
jgi:hypothetical protein